MSARDQLPALLSEQAITLPARRLVEADLDAQIRGKRLLTCDANPTTERFARRTNESRPGGAEYACALERPATDMYAASSWLTLGMGVALLVLVALIVAGQL